MPRTGEKFPITVIGAGVVGLATAMALDQRGAEVTILERSAELGGNASWLAGGMLAAFCEGESAPASVVERGAKALDWWRQRVPGVVRNGTLVLAPPRDVGEIDRFAARTREWERVDADAIGELEPDLAGRFRKGLFFRSEGHLDPRVAMAALTHGLKERGVEIRFGANVAGAPLPVSAGEGRGEGRRPSPPSSGASRHLLPRAGEGLIVDCRGYSARDALPELRGVRGEMLLVRTREIALKRPVRLLHPRIPLYVVPRADGLFMIGATMIESADKGGVSVRSAIELLSAAYALHPAFGEAEIVEMRADVRPAFPDNEPRILERGGRIYVNGFYRHGFLLSPHYAERAAGQIAGSTPKANSLHLGRWLVEDTPRGFETEPPSRADIRSIRSGRSEKSAVIRGHDLE
jgi:glycine oxidase